MITIQCASLGLSAAVEPIIRALPDWFGVETSIQMYLRDVAVNPTFLAVDPQHENKPVGFLTLLHHTATAAEVYIMAVVPQCHRSGIGRALLRAAEAHLRSEGIRFLQVKVVSDEHPDAGYEATRAFYKAMGFTLLEEFADLWGPHHPCWQMIKKL